MFKIDTSGSVRSNTALPYCNFTPGHRHASGPAQQALVQQHRFRLETPSQICRCSADGQSPAEGTTLASEFSRHVNTAGLRSPLEHRGPTPMMSPTAVVAAQLDALQMNDWPDTDSGIRTAFLFSKPYDCENLIAGQATPSHCHSWVGTETWIPFKEFSNALHSAPHSVLLNCESWRAVSNVVFPSSRKGNKAVQAVEVMAVQRNGDGKLRPYVFTFCLERVDVGPYKGCWMTVGLRCGNYST